MIKKRLNHTVDFGGIKAPCAGKLIYLLFISCADKTGEVRNIPVKNMSAILGISKSTVSRNLKRLKKNGYLSVQPHYKQSGMRDINTYIIK